MKITLIFFLVALLLVAGCGVDDPEIPPATGTVIIDAQPDSFIFGYYLLQPGHTRPSVGVGDQTLENMRLGEYSISWSWVDDDWLRPPDETQYLAAGDTLIFIGIYVRVIGGGTIILDPDSDHPNAP